MSTAPHAGAPKPRSTNGFAIASLVFGIFGGILFGIVFGFVALSQIKQRGQAGRGMAISGIVLSGLWIVGIGVVVAFALTTSANRDASGRITEAGSVSVTDLRVGDCMKAFPQGEEVFSVDGVPCRDLHGGEVYATFELEGGEDWPGIGNVTRRADAGCTNRLEAIARSALARDLDVEAGPENVSYLHPTQDSWESLDDREVTCIAVFDPPVKGPLTS